MRGFTGQRNKMPGMGVFVRMPTTNTIELQSLEGAGMVSVAGGGAGPVALNYNYLTGWPIPGNSLVSPWQPLGAGWNMTAAPLSSTSIIINWGAFSSMLGTLGLKLYRSPVPSTSLGTLIWSGSTPTSTFTDTGLTPSTTYLYQLVISQPGFGVVDTKNAFGTTSATGTPPSVIPIQAGATASFLGSPTDASMTVRVSSVSGYPPLHNYALFTVTYSMTYGGPRTVTIVSVSYPNGNVHYVTGNTSSGFTINLYCLNYDGPGNLDFVITTS